MRPLSRNQLFWLDEIKRRGRILVGRLGVPQKTADSLARRGLVRLEWQDMSSNPARAKMQDLYAVYEPPSQLV